ncbi:class I SAM-dependent methyltransferase [Blastopirellula sp. JC732]|uniref:Class I SAM-dependent methyltransferase n=1 Tax=Blastopirellula sediminis TaxID=2894196 RepID=A0A9X1MRL2_9BACT|nr:class I SAM-dependent methyltransferase [Blastopirellula sediminis]MCC9605119.1 class I SAM-dependent methyltransferase [Blastopirellula sediminis]MCC9631581.1 class I SAM-dependent methyltransferase [Blastopirellula sediminis]
MSPNVDETSASAPAKTRKTVKECYDFFDCVFPACGLRDLTEGMYHGDPTGSYQQAQRNQVEWLLDQVHCQAGSRILDIGFGYGTLLEAARDRGAHGVGISVSPPQVERGLANGLDVRLLNYRNMGEEWNEQFDAVIANGSAEHFVHPDDIIAGRADQIYRELFRICHRLIDPASPSRRFATTIIHCNDRTPVPTFAELKKSPFAFAWRSPKFHYAMIQQTFGGFYPEPQQLERCAQDYFRLSGEVDGTEDYHLTSEQWFAHVRRQMMSLKNGPRIFGNLVRQFCRRPRHTTLMLICLLVTESWQEQFRGEHPATTLLRQTWDYVPSPVPLSEEIAETKATLLSS